MKPWPSIPTPALPATSLDPSVGSNKLNPIERIVLSSQAHRCRKLAPSFHAQSLLPNQPSAVSVARCEVVGVFGTRENVGLDFSNPVSSTTRQFL
ncbi:hypothetical protein PM082_001834 [Marasmius tenuissimus]|nr:hypothetical protein PM082_001834 [Marasmius tenuissimus]